MNGQNIKYEYVINFFGIKQEDVESESEKIFTLNELASRQNLDNTLNMPMMASAELDKYINQNFYSDEEETVIYSDSDNCYNYPSF